MNKIIYALLLIIVTYFAYWLGTSSGSRGQPSGLLNSTITHPSVKTKQESVAELSSQQNESQQAKASAIEKQTAAVDAESNKLSYQQLEQINQTLEQKYIDQQYQNQRLSERYAKARQLLLQAGIEEPTSISKEEVEAILPAPFDNVIFNAPPDILDNFKSFNEQEQDYDWAIQFETRVSDFFALHQLSELVKLEDVSCKQSKCQLYGFNEDAAAYTQVMQDLAKQEWYQASQTSSMTGDTRLGQKEAKARKYFYVLADISR